MKAILHKQENIHNNLTIPASVYCAVCKCCMHCKSDGDKIQMCFTKLVCKTVKLYSFICYITIQLVNLGGFFPHWLVFQGVSPIGWYSKYTM